MGMFDRVWVNCPSCDQQVELQSKAGPCRLADYTEYSCPLGVLEDISEYTQRCEKCKASFYLDVQTVRQVRIVEGAKPDEVPED